MKLTQKQADTLRAIARGENPCAKVAGEEGRATGGRRRVVTDLYCMSLVEYGPRLASGRLDPAAMPVLTDKGRAAISENKP